MSKAGKKSGYTSTKGHGLSLEDQIDQAYYGDAAITKGGTIARRYLEELDRIVGGKVKRDASYLWKYEAEITSALVKGDAETFREIADFLKAKAALKKQPPKVEIFWLALNYVDWCRLPGPGRKPFLPTVEQVYEFVCQKLPANDPPDIKTIYEMRRNLGLKLADGKRGRKKGRI